MTDRASSSTATDRLIEEYEYQLKTTVDPLCPCAFFTGGHWGCSDCPFPGEPVVITSFDDYSDRIEELKAALSEIYAIRGEDADIARIINEVNV